MGNTVNKISFVLLALIFIAYSFFALKISQDYAPTSPDENQYIFYSKFFAENNSFVYINPLNQQFPEKVFTARNYAQEGEKTLPGGFLGQYIIGGLAYKLNPVLIFFISPIFGILTLIYIYKLSRFFVNDTASLSVAFLISIFPPFFLFSVVPFNNIIEAFFFTSFIYYLVKIYFTGNNQIRDLILACTMAMGSIWIRYIDVVFIAIAGVVFAIIYKPIFKIKYLFTAFCISSLFMLPLLYSNYVLYGGIFELGQVGERFLNISIFNPLSVEQFSPLIPFRNLDFFINNARKYLFNFLGLYLVLAVISIATLLKKDKENKKIYYFLIATILSYFLYYLGGYFSGYDDPDPLVNSSYTRYLLIPYIFLLLLVGIGIFRQKYFAKYIVLILIFFSILSFQQLAYSKESLSTYLKRVARLNQQKKEFISKTENNSVIFTKYNDKILYPERNVASYLFIKDEFKGTEKLIVDLLNKNYPVYWIDETSLDIGPSFNEYRNEFKDSFDFKLIDDKSGLYKVTINE